MKRGHLAHIPPLKERGRSQNFNQHIKSKVSVVGLPKKVKSAQQKNKFSMAFLHYSSTGYRNTD